MKNIIYATSVIYYKRVYNKTFMLKYLKLRGHGFRDPGFYGPGCRDPGF